MYKRVRTYLFVRAAISISSGRSLIFALPAGRCVVALATWATRYRRERSCKRRWNNSGNSTAPVNNASFLGPRVPISEYPVSAWEDVVRINLTGSFLMIQETLKIMIPRSVRGSVINVSSGVGRTGKARWGAYAASKFGVEGLTQVLADEVRESAPGHSVQSGPDKDGDARSGLSRRGSTCLADSGSCCSPFRLSGLGRFWGSYRPVLRGSRLARAPTLTSGFLFCK